MQTWKLKGYLYINADQILSQPNGWFNAKCIIESWLKGRGGWGFIKIFNNNRRRVISGSTKTEEQKKSSIYVRMSLCHQKVYDAQVASPQCTLFSLQHFLF